MQNNPGILAVLLQQAAMRDPLSFNRCSVPLLYLCMLTLP